MKALKLVTILFALAGAPVAMATVQSTVENATGRAAGATAPPAAPQIRKALSNLAIPFVKNAGQTDPAVAFYASTFSGTVFVTRRGSIVYSLRSSARRAHGQIPTATWSVTEDFVGGHASPVAHAPAATQVSFFVGDQPDRWRTQVPTATNVSLGDVYPGINVTLKAYGEQMEKVFAVRPGATPRSIHVRVAGAHGLSLSADGSLVVRTGVGEVRMTPPVAYQEIDGTRQAVEVAYAVTGTRYGFRVGRYDRTRPLIIDPLLQATYLGGRPAPGFGDYAAAIAIHPLTGEIYVAGIGQSVDFPGTTGGAQSKPGVNGDAFIARLNPGLTTLKQATYLGGNNNDGALELAFDASTGNVYVAGFTESTNLPGRAGGAQPSNGGPCCGSDGFVALLDASLTHFIQSTYYGGTNSEQIQALALDPATGTVYVAGDTSSINLPGTTGNAQSGPGGGSQDGFVARLNGSLTNLQAATYFGGSGNEVIHALARNATTGEVYVAGESTSTNLPGSTGGAQSTFAGGAFFGDAFVARLNANLTVLDQATYLGGNDQEQATAVALDNTGNVYVAGWSTSDDFPGTSGGAQSVRTVPFATYTFVARLNGALTTLDQSTYLGDGGQASALVINATSSEVYVVGGYAGDLASITGGAQSVPGCCGDSFAARLDPSLTVLHQSTYLGGSDNDVATALAIDEPGGLVYVAGYTSSSDFPATLGGAQSTFAGGNSDISFIARLTADLATSCGNGSLDAGEECDDGNVVSGDSCPSAPGDNCQYSASRLLIRGSRRNPAHARHSCQTEWYVAHPSRDRYGLPSNTQTCHDQDPSCDLDPTPGQCRFQVVVCLNNTDINLPLCTPAGVSRITVERPDPRRGRTAHAQALLSADRAALDGALTHLHDPLAPGSGYASSGVLGTGEHNFCSAPFPIDVGFGTHNAVRLLVKSRDANRAPHTSALTLVCDQ